MIHWEYRRDQEFDSCGGAPPQERLWDEIKGRVRERSAVTAALLDVEARVAFDPANKRLSLALHPGLRDGLAERPARKAVLEAVVAEVLGPDWTLTFATAPETAIASSPFGEAGAPFERARRLTEDGEEFWSSRDLAKVLGYRSHRSFEAVLARAEAACQNSGHDPADHFADAVPFGEPARTRYLSRYACYLLIQNSNPAKSSVAQGQTYFAVQARRQEVAERHADMEDRRRLMLRREVAAHNKRLAAAARNAGVVASDDFREFQNQGYRGLYGGLSAGKLRVHRGLAQDANVLDFMGSTELAANLFRATQTEEKIRRDRVQGKEEACRLHHMVGAKVRQTMREISGVMPEALPAVEDIHAVQRRLKAAQQKALGLS